MTASQLLLLGGAQAPAVDPFFYSVTSLLHGDGTNGAQNNTFLDSSTNNFTITRNGNTTQGSFSPFSQTGWSNFFGSTNSDWINFSASSALSFASDFTVEAWVYNNYSSGTFTAAVLYDSSSSAISAFEINNGTVYPSVAGITSTNTVTRVNFTGSTVPVGQWVHVAWVRSSGVVRVYVNGFVGPTTLSNSATTGQFVQVANARTSGNSWNGYISNLRITSSAVYTSNFTPSTTPLTAIAGTQLLTCQSNRFRDASTNALTPTLVGSTSSVQPFSPFNPLTPYSTSAVGGSGYFDGSGDYLETTSSQIIPSGNFTIEAWAYITSSSSTQTIVAQGTGVGDGARTWMGIENSSGAKWAVQVGGTQAISSVTPVLNAWHYLAMVYNGSTIKMYLNGTEIASASSTTNASNTTLKIGTNWGSYITTGFISNIRISNTARTISAVPSSLLTTDANTVFLANFTNAGIFDNAADADYETVGNAQISTSVKKYGTGSMAFDGTGDYLVAPSRAITALTGDFTIEFWSYRTSGTYRGFTIGDDNTSTGLSLYYSTGSSAWVVYNNNTSRITGGTSTTGEWQHMALVRCAGIVKLYVNGTQVGSTWSSTGTFSGNVYVSAEYYAGTAYADTNGYMDDFRISNGVCRYPYNFTPPTAEFPNIGGTVTLTADPYYDYTTLLLPGNGTNGAQNNTFLDSSTNAFSITRNGNTTQGTFSPFSQTGWGNFFDGTGDYLTFPADAAFTFGTGDFTIEGWVYISALDAVNAKGIFQQGTSSFPTSVSNSVALGVNPAATWAIYAKNAATNSTATATLNSWTHFALVRSGTTTTLYANGTSVITVTADSTNYTGTFFGVGSIYGTSGTNWNGYISNVRVVKGTAVYTANFTPSTTPLTAISGTSLLTCQSNRFVDNSSNAFAITRNGDVSVQAFSPFNPTAAWSAATYGGSGYFDGSGDYLSVADAAAMELGSGNWTIEMWVNTTNSTAYSALFARDDGGTTAGSYVILLNGATANGIVSFWSADVNSFGAAVLTSGTVNCRDGAWHHIAVVRNSNTLTMYIDGTSTSTATFTGAFANTAQPILIGAETGYSRPYTGYMANIRLVIGAAVYTANFTPPTAPLTAISNTQLLLNFTNAGIYDATSKNDLETVGNAQISTTQSKFGGSSIYLDGNGDRLIEPASPNLALGSGDFTIECWLRRSSASSAQAAILQMSAGADSYSLLFGYTSGASLVIYISSNGSSWDIASAQTLGTVQNDTWVHYALTRYGSTFRAFQDGVQQSTWTSSASIYQATNQCSIGYAQGTHQLAGYIDDLRITKGIARYTSNFTPPTTAFLTL